MTIRSRRVLHVVQISFFSDPTGRSPAQLLDAWPTLVRRRRGRVPIRAFACRSSRLAHIRSISTRRGVHYYFLPFGDGQRDAFAENAAFGALLQTLAPDVFHVHGLGFPRDVLSLASLGPGRSNHPARSCE